MKLKKIILTLIFSIIISISTNSYAMVTTQNYVKNINSNGKITYNDGNSYYWNYGYTVQSYLEPLSDGGFNRIEREDNDLFIEKYDNNFNLKSKKSIDIELPKFGGFFAGENYNFIVFGQDNPQYDDSLEVIRVVKYSKDWVRIGATSLSAINTYKPFEAGSCRMMEYGGILHIDTCHTMYPSSDGYNHQSNMMFWIRESDMVCTYKRTGVVHFDYGYASHSFNQFILKDSVNYFTIDHGDAYPRSVVIYKFGHGNTKIKGYTNAYVFQGETGNNTTGATLGGAEISSNNILIAGTSVDQTNGTLSDAKNVMLLVTNKSTFQTTVKWFTNYQSDSTVRVGNPHLVKINDNKFLLMWQDSAIRNKSDIVKAVLIDENGNNVSNIITFEGKISDCKPVLNGDKVVWYASNNSKLLFFYLDVSSISKFETYNTKFFDDVSYLDWYATSVRFTTNNEMIKGYSDKVFAPQEKITRGQLVTILHRIEGMPKADIESKFKDVKDSKKYYYSAVMWASKNRVVNGFKDGTFKPNENITRQDLAVILNNYAKYKNKDISKKGDISEYTDANKISKYAFSAMEWAVGTKVITGNAQTQTLNPKGNATRAEAAAMLEKYYINVER